MADNGGDSKLRLLRIPTIGVFHQVHPEKPSLPIWLQLRNYFSTYDVGWEAKKLSPFSRWKIAGGKEKKAVQLTDSFCHASMTSLNNI